MLTHHFKLKLTFFRIFEDSSQKQIKVLHVKLFQKLDQINNDQRNRILFKLNRTQIKKQCMFFSACYHTSWQKESLLARHLTRDALFTRISNLLLISRIHLIMSQMNTLSFFFIKIIMTVSSYSHLIVRHVIFAASSLSLIVILI